MAYKIETHMHTPLGSPCGKVPVEVLVERYHRAGYAALTVTDHFSLDAFSRLGHDPEEEDPVNTFLEGYRLVREAAEKLGMRAYYGAELRFHGSSNDYLLFGFPPELLARPRQVWAMGLASFYPLARQAGAALIQAHPFRHGCVPVAPCFVDGYEVMNRHDKHNNRNHLALELARRYGTLGTGGGDYHDDDDRCVGGIEADRLPRDSAELAKLILSGDFRLLGRQ